MSEPLTLDQLTAALAATEQRIITETEKRLTKRIDDATVPHFTAIQTDLGRITSRLDRIENILWDGQRVAEIERRVIKLAETVGRADLATPITRPLGS
ncbi:MAG: hypothetical protein ACHQ9S_19340 [Candidatus Binatia bacterium]